MQQQCWWKEATAYEIWPASFKDANDDGFGDIRGIIEKLDYLKSLGVDLIWVCPVFESPFKDGGYDVSNFERIAPRYGTLEDVDDLISECHSRDMKLMFDLVINHTSDEHEWFRESRASRDNAKRDWYIWRPPRFSSSGERGPPNNWRSRFGGSAWTWDEGTQEYYLHLYTTEQPDLNWRSTAAREAIYESAIRFWLRRGIDGFRIDVANMFSKPEVFEDAPIRDPSSPYQLADHVWCNGPHMHQYHREIAEVLQPYGAVTVGELPNTPDLDDVKTYISRESNEMNMVFLMDIVWLGLNKDCRYNIHQITAQAVKAELIRSQSLADDPNCWPTVFLENHDQARSIPRFASADSEQSRLLSGKLLAMMLAACSGTLFLYQGQELGMVNIPPDWNIEEYQDIQSLNYINLVKSQPEHGEEKTKMSDVLAGLNAAARDNSRTPIQWNKSQNAGFTSGKPWMRVNENYKQINAEDQLGDSESVFSFWKQILQLRKRHKDVFIYGQFEILQPDAAEQISFIKRAGEQVVLVDLNFSEKTRKLYVPKGCHVTEMLAWNGSHANMGSLGPWEGVICKLGNSST